MVAGSRGCTESDTRVLKNDIKINRVFSVVDDLCQPFFSRFIASHFLLPASSNWFQPSPD